MGFWTCSAHGIRVMNHSPCPSCADEEYAATQRERMIELKREEMARQRAREAEDGVCECCGQRFVERTRVRQSAGAIWSGVLGRYAISGVCPACYNKHGG